MIPTGSKLWFGVAGFALVATVAYFIASNGEEYGSMVLLSLVVAAFTLGLLSSFIGDGDLRDQRGPEGATDGQVALADGPGHSVGSQLAAAWPVMAAVGVGVAVVGLATGGLLLYLGLLLVVAAGVEWMVQAWAERATPDPDENRSLRNRLMYPIEIPVLAAAAIGVVIVAFSRVLLAVSKVGSTVVAIVVAVLILGAAFLVTSRPRLSSSLLTAVVGIGVLGLLGGGIVGAVAGERSFEVHEGEEHGGEGEGGEGEGVAAEALMSASNTSGYDEDLINVPSGVPVTFTFENRQGGVQHNVHITEPEDLAQTDVITGPASTTFEVTFEEPGEFTFVCDVHPAMEGTIEAVEQPSEGGGAESEEAPDEGSEGGGAGVDELDGDGS
ncbi:MAG: cytochrome c oxidase subunit 4 [Actinomycetota bacterium]|nr:cytochrome c oxidase subunit 4 [Actinomycetota bacterium]